MVATLQEDFILMAKAKGITNRRILWRHALRPSSLTLLTVAGLNVGALIGGTVVIEVIFQLPGMGLLVVHRHYRTSVRDAAEHGGGDRDRLCARERHDRHPVLDPRSEAAACSRNRLAPSPTPIWRRSSRPSRPRAGTVPPAAFPTARHRRVARDRLARHRGPRSAILIPILLHSNATNNALAGHSQPGPLQGGEPPARFRPRRQRHALEPRQGRPQLDARRRSARSASACIVGGGLGLIAGYFRARRRRHHHHGLQRVALDPAVRARPLARHRVRDHGHRQDRQPTSSISRAPPRSC